MSKENYLKDLFIDEAKPALQRHSGGGGGSGSSDLIECESLPTEGVQEGKIYRARWSETVEIPPGYEVWCTDGDGSPAINITELEPDWPLVTVNSFSDIPIDADGSCMYLCLDEGVVYLQPYKDATLGYGGEDVGYIDDPSELDVNIFQVGVRKSEARSVTTNYEQIGIPATDRINETLLYEDGKWNLRGLIRNLINATGTKPTQIFCDNNDWKSLDGLIGFNDFSDVTNTAGVFQSCRNLTKVPLFDTSKVKAMQYMFQYCTALTEVPLFDTSNVTLMNSMFEGCSSLTEVPLFDTSNVTDMTEMFSDCSALTEVPLFDTSKVTTMNSMFDSCNSLTTVPLFDTSKVTAMSGMFSCYDYGGTKPSSLTTVPEFDTSNVTVMRGMFNHCNSLTTVPAFDIRNVTETTNMFEYCISLTECWIRNIKANLQVGSGTYWGSLLTVDSLVHLIYELRDTGSSKTLTVGSANLEKLASVYVKTVEITDEMRVEDDLVDEKLPFVVCESTDEGACLIVDYATFKNWKIQ